MNIEIKRKLFLSLMVCFFGLVGSSRLPGADIDPVLKERIDNSDLIVIGKVIEARAVREDGLIFTIVTFSVEKTLKGDPQSDRIKIRVLGGSVGNIGLLITEPVANFDLNERALTFLRVVKKRPEYYRVFDEEEGKYTITTDGRIQRTGVPLEEMVNQIETYLKDLKDDLKN